MASDKGDIQHATIAIEAAPNSDERELDELTMRLRQRLLELDVQRVDRVRSDDVPEGAKPVDAIIIGALGITLGPQAVKAVVGLVQAWLRSRPVRRIKITIGKDSIDLTDPTTPERQELVQAFIDRHSGQ
jgi:hypothetical protein